MSETRDRAVPARPSEIAPSDESLLDDAARGDSLAIGQLYDRYQGLMYGLASRITRDPILAQDVVQEALVGIWRNAPRFSSSRASARTWILSITHHRAVDAVRRRRPTTEIPEPDAAAPPRSLVLPDIWPEVALRLDAQLVRAAMGNLSSAQREAIELAYFAGLTQQEIAVRTGAPLGTVKSRVRLGLLQLREALGAASTAASARQVGGRDARSLPADAYGQSDADSRAADAYGQSDADALARGDQR
jgi:RNA polymerase sigma-70 factor (ECF subfamily)